MHFTHCVVKIHLLRSSHVTLRRALLPMCNQNAESLYTWYRKFSMLGFCCKILHYPHSRSNVSSYRRPTFGPSNANIKPPGVFTVMYFRQSFCLCPLTKALCSVPWPPSWQIRILEQSTKPTQLERGVSLSLVFSVYNPFLNNLFHHFSKYLWHLQTKHFTCCFYVASTRSGGHLLKDQRSSHDR